MGAQPALIETWALYTFGSLVILARIVCRWRMIGIYNFKPDDYLIVLAWIIYTVMTATAHIVGEHGDLHGLTIQQREVLTSEEAEPFILGTKMFCVGVATYITFIWLLKMNMLFLYQRVVNGLWVEKFILPTMGLVVVTYIAIMMILFLPCRPYSRIWIVFPDQGEYCKPQSFLNMVPPLVMNLVTDLLIMAVPAPVILPVKTTLARKVGLSVLFFAGIFIMTAAILRVVFVVMLKTGPTAAIWSCREDAVAILVGQAIMIKPLFTKKFWSRDFASGKNAPSSKRAYYNSGPPSAERSGIRRGFGKPKDPFSLSAALATVHSNEPVDKLSQPSSSSSQSVIPSTPSIYPIVAYPPPRYEANLEIEGEQPEDFYRVHELLIQKQSQNHQREMQEVPRADPPADRMFIEISREIDVVNCSVRTNSVRVQHEAGPGTRDDYFHLTTNANCWNGTRIR